MSFYPLFVVFRIPGNLEQVHSAWDLDAAQSLAVYVPVIRYESRPWWSYVWNSMGFWFNY